MEIDPTVVLMLLSVKSHEAHSFVMGKKNSVKFIIRERLRGGGLDEYQPKSADREPYRAVKRRGKSAPGAASPNNGLELSLAEIESVRALSEKRT